MDVKIESGYGRLEDVRLLFEEYKKNLNEDLSFQPEDESTDEIAGRYAAPGGCILLASCEGKAAGCIAFHPMANGRDCELKRFFVRQVYRGLHLGDRLIRAAMEKAKASGYDNIYLDTLSRLAACNYMYHKLGFELIEPYYENPLPGVLYYRLKL